MKNFEARHTYDARHAYNCSNVRKANRVIKSIRQFKSSEGYTYRSYNFDTGKVYIMEWMENYFNGFIVDNSPGLPK